MAILLPACQQAPATPSTADTADIDPQAQSVVDAFGKYLREIKGFAVTLEQQLEITSRGRTDVARMKQELKAERPNHLALARRPG